jgi:3',5'-nucleoside bisphosphate phosphatase
VKGSTTVSNACGRHWKVWTSSALIDLHTHTTESDGTLSPAELMAAAAAIGLEAIAITDHDTFSGYDAALPEAAERGVNLLCGIEISTTWGKPKERTVHLLGYFFSSPPAPDFRAWLAGIQSARRDRNVRLAARLRELGMNIQLEEVEALGRNMTGRPHFARTMVRKGYARDIRDAFDRFLDESAVAYVYRDEPMFEDVVQRVIAAGGLASLAHPIRLDRRDSVEEERTIATMVDMGLPAIEVWHSDHSATDTLRYLKLVQKFGLRATGGSDFHGDVKPNVSLGQLNIPRSVLDSLYSVNPETEPRP